ncbi:MAG: ABC transporter ATP-binding protein [Bacteroidota bacterium]
MLAYFRIIAYGKSYLWLGGLALGFLLVYTVFSAVSLVSVIPFLEILFSQTPIPAPQTDLSLWDGNSLKAHGYYALSQQIQHHGASQVLIWFCVGLLFAILLKNLSRYLTQWFIAPLEQGIILQLRTHLFAHLTRLGLSYYSKEKKGEIISVVVNDVQLIQESVLGTLLAIFREPITILTFLLTLLFLSWKLTLFVLIILPLTGLVINAIAGPLKRSTRKGQQALASLTSLLEEFIGGVRIIKAFRKESFISNRYLNRNQEYTKRMIAVRRKADLASPITEVLSIGVVCLIIYYGSSLILNQQSHLKPSEFIGFIAIFSQVLGPIKVLSNAFTKIQKGNAAYERVEQLLQRSPEIHEPSLPQSLLSFETSIRFEQVVFRYEDVDVLKNISFSLDKGKTVALVGPSGGGKSTLADLIPRFYDPQQGQILIDEHPIKTLKLSNLRKLVGQVNQEGILFHDTVRNNIAFGESQMDNKKVEEAAKIAYAHDFIMDLPDQYDTLIGERGTMLSGGQQQRLTIARAVYHNPPILILDEATSNLDTQSELLVQQALDSLMSNRTSLVIAHRLSTIQHADLILVIDQGRIMERGTHQELLQKGGLYQQLYSLQFQS